MIQLTQLDGSTLWLNPDHLVRLESRPDTTLTLYNGDKILVRDSAAAVAERFRAFKEACGQGTILSPLAVMATEKETETEDSSEISETLASSDPA